MAQQKKKASQSTKPDCRDSADMQYISNKKHQIMLKDVDIEEWQKLGKQGRDTYIMIVANC